MFYQREAVLLHLCIMAIRGRLFIQDTVNQQNPESLHFSLFTSGGASVKASCFWMTELSLLKFKQTYLQRYFWSAVFMHVGVE